MIDIVTRGLGDYLWDWRSNATLLTVLGGGLLWVLSHWKVLADAVTKVNSLFEKLPTPVKTKLELYARGAWPFAGLLVLAAFAGIDAYGRRWAGVGILAAGVLVAGAAAWFLWRRVWGLAAAQLVLALAAVGGEQAFYQQKAQRQWNQDKVYVILPARAFTDEKAEELQRFWREYVNTHQQVFAGVTGLRIEPALWKGRDPVDPARLSDWDQQLDPARPQKELAKSIQHLLHRGRFCPAVVILSRVGFFDTGGKARGVRATHEFYVEAVASPTAPVSLPTVNLPTGRARLTSDDVTYLALRLAFSVIEALPQLRCDPSPRLSDAERDAAVQRLMAQYRQFLAVSPRERQPADLLDRVNILVSRPPVKLEDALKVLDAYGIVDRDDPKLPSVPPRTEALAAKLGNL